MMLRKACALLCLGALVNQLFIIAPRAETVATTKELSLSDALASAYERNPRMVQARQAIASAEGEAISAGAWANPGIEAEIGGLRASEDGSHKGHLDAVSFKQPFDPPGVRALNKRVGRNTVDIQRASLKDVWSGVYVDVRAAYTRLILNQKELELKQGNLKSMRQFFSDVQVRYQGGQALKNHVQRARIELLKAESDYLRVENERDIETARLNLLIGRERETPLTITDELSAEPLTLTLDQLMGLALEKRPDLLMQEILLDSRKHDVKREQLSRLPSYALGFEMMDEDFEEDYAAVVEIRVPLWSWNRGAVKTSRAERDAQASRVEALKDEIAFEVYAAYKDARLAVRQLDLYKQSLAEANEMFRLAGLRYGEGHIDFLNYLDQLLASLDSRMQYYQGLYHLSQSISTLEKAVYSSLRKEDFLP